MNESTFQKLSSDFLNFKGYNLIGVLGAVIGKNKTSKGNPDLRFNCGTSFNKLN